MKSLKAVSRLRDVDSADQALRIHALSWSFFGAVFGSLVGLLTAGLTGSTPWLAATVGALAGGGLVYVFTTVLPELLGRAVGAIVWPSGRGNPPRSDHSLGDARRLQGEFYDAMAAYREEAEARPNDPAPRLRAARLLRDEMGRYQEAAHWFRQALAVSSSLEGRYSVLREMVEMAVQRWREPWRVLPDLARFAEEQEGTAPGTWAHDEGASIKASIPADRWRSD
jgi:hypothetical protein